MRDGFGETQQKPTLNASSRSASSRSVIAMLSLCGIVVSLQQTMFLPLLAELPALLNTSASSASWLVTATLLTGAVATPVVSRLADMYGKKRLLMAALGVSVAGSLLGALSDAVPLLIGARSLQGVGVALVPVGIAIMRDELPKDRVPLAVATMSATLAIGAGVGLPLSGLISQHLDWHACFWVTGVIGMLLMLGTWSVVRESPVRTGGAFDARGAVLLSLALSAVLVALSQGSHWGWTDAATGGLLLGGLVLLALWVPIELRTPRPLVDLRVASRRAVLVVNVASVFAGFAMFVNMLVSMQILQAPFGSGYGRGLDVFYAGLWMVPHAAAFGLMAPVSAWCTRRYGPQTSLSAGSAIMAVTYIGRVHLSDTTEQVVVGSVLVGIGTALVYSAMPTLIMRAVPVTETASANGLNVLLRSMGTSTASAVTAAVGTTWVVQTGGMDYPSRVALSAMFWLAAGAASCTWLLGAVMARMPEYATGVDRAGTEHHGPNTQIAKGRVVDPQGAPIRSAVVTVLTEDGHPVDWAQADSEGRFVVAIPGAADYLVVTTADGWRPRSRIVRLGGVEPSSFIGLRERLTLEGTVTDAAGRAVIGALVVLTKQSGELIGTIATDHGGRYEIPRPTSGRYVLTVSASGGRIGARAVTVLDTPRDVDITLGTPLA